MLFSFLFVVEITLALFLLVVALIRFIEKYGKHSLPFALSGLALVIISFFTFFFAYSYGTTWVNGGTKTFVVKEIDIFDS